MIITKENIMYNSMYDPENDTCDNISRRSETAQVVTDQGSNKRYPVSIWKYDDEGKLVKVRQISGRILDGYKYDSKTDTLNPISFEVSDRIRNYVMSAK
jgi:FKBP-type peptidyl-prolyl cis-trans isomerase